MNYLESIHQYGKEEKLKNLFKAINKRKKEKKWFKLQSEVISWDYVSICTHCGEYYSPDFREFETDYNVCSKKCLNNEKFNDGTYNKDEDSDEDYKKQYYRDKYGDE
jgi:hypothetical protein